MVNAPDACGLLDLTNSHYLLKQSRLFQEIYVKGRKIGSAGVHVTRDISKKEPCIDSKQLAILFAAKCKDLRVSSYQHQGPLQKRFE